MFPSHLSHKYKNPFAAHVPTPLLLPLRSGSRACVWVLRLGLGLFRLFCHRGCELSDASQPTPHVGPWSWPGQPTSVNFNEVSNGSSSFATHPVPPPPLAPSSSNSCRHDFLAALFICFCFCYCYCCCNCVFIAGCCCAGISHCLCCMVGVLNEASGVFQRPRIPTSCAALFEGC